MKKILKQTKELAKIFAIPAAVVGIFGTFILGVAGYNQIMNNRIINSPAYQTGSYATGIIGHVEYTKYSNGSQDVKEYPNFGYRMFSSEIHQDLNGDGLVDRIREEGPEFKMHRLSTILVRENDYLANKERFDQADKQLQELIKKYSVNKK